MANGLHSAGGKRSRCVKGRTALRNPVFRLVCRTKRRGDEDLGFFESEHAAKEAADPHYEQVWYRSNNIPGATYSVPVIKAKTPAWFLVIPVGDLEYLASLEAKKNPWRTTRRTRIGDRFKDKEGPDTVLGYFETFEEAIAAAAPYTGTEKYSRETWTPLNRRQRDGSLYNALLDGYVTKVNDLEYLASLSKKNPGFLPPEGQAYKLVYVTYMEMTRLVGVGSAGKKREAIFEDSNTLGVFGTLRTAKKAAVDVLASKAVQGKFTSNAEERWDSSALVKGSYVETVYARNAPHDTVGYFYLVPIDALEYLARSVPRSTRNPSTRR